MKEKAEETPNCFPVKETWLTEEVIERLPYSLTNAQLNAWHEIERDLAGRTMMSRLYREMLEAARRPRISCDVPCGR